MAQNNQQSDEQEERLSLSTSARPLLEECRMVLPGMTPAAIHRRMGARHVSQKFIETSTRLLVASMFPLAIGICIDFYLIARIIVGSASAALLLSLIVLSVFISLWFLLPRLRFSRLGKGKPRSQRKELS